ncbi:hypothetical protein IWX81_001461 [Salinibacterium sp. CAN_S4]|uniref:hypothetical protein n=1 Tax=Salinibacterium sp. CAN_S4 TaxID=2787727 RepID=UPI0018EF7DF8
MTRASLIATSAAIAIAIALTGCTDNASPTPTPTPTASADPTPGITDIIDTPGSGEGLEGALSDSEVTTCELADGSWTVDGTLTNSSAVAANYRLYVSLLAGDGDTRALTQVNVDGVEPTQSSPWSTQIAVSDADLSCVLRVERYPAVAPEPEPTETGDDTEG